MLPLEFTARLKTCSLNVNGLQDETKRRNIFNFLRNQDCDIFLLQEVHAANLQECAKWTSEWEGQAFWSCGTSRARGVAILFKKNFNFNILYKNNDLEGRILSLCINIESTSIQLVNVYAPNIPTERKNFFNNIFNYAKLGFPTIVGGDFNCIEDVNIDKWGGSPLYGEAGKIELINFLNNFNVTDIYRHVKPQGREITWRDKNGTVGCRLDRFYLPVNFLTGFTSCEILPCGFTDHYLVKTHCEIPDSLPRGKGVWKFNVSLLQHDCFCSEVKSFWAA